MFRWFVSLLVAMACSAAGQAFATTLAVCPFQCDATPPLGSPLCYASVEPAKEIVDKLTVRGVILFVDGPPIVLCAVDWVGIGNGTHQAFREALATAVNTSVDCVTVHTLHQHDAPGVDADAEALLASNGLSGGMFHVAHTRKVIEQAALAAKRALAVPRPVTHLGVGTAKVERVASNRRILGPDGKVQYVRYSSCTIPEAIAAPEGVIDPEVKVVSFWNGEKPVVVLSYYATHPQSYYGKGGVSWDFVGMARAQRDKALPGVMHVHFNGASGNVAAGKYNDGTPERRPELAGRLADGMAAAFKNTKKVPVTGMDVDWKTVEVTLPPREDMQDEATLLALLGNKDAQLRERYRAARELAWIRRVKNGPPIELSCLKLPGLDVLHMPGELFIEYQLAAAKMKPQDTVCMAAYGEYAPGYIGTEVSYTQGGYETGPVSLVAPQVEKVLMDAMAQLLK